MTTQLTRGSSAPAALDGSGRRGPSRRALALGAVAVVALAAVGAWLLAFSSVLGVKTVKITGEQTVTSAQIAQAAQIRTGTPLLRLDTAAIARRVEQLPEIASAQVRTALPSTVTITVHERVPIGYLQNGTRFTLVDATGAQFHTQSTQPGNLPRFEVPSGSAAQASAAAVATVAAALPRSLLAKITSIQALDPTAITLLLTDQRVVRWGGADQSALKATLLPALLTQPGTTIDLTDPQQPFTH